MNTIHIFLAAAHHLLFTHSMGTSSQFTGCQHKDWWPTTSQWYNNLKGIATSISPDRTRLISILLSNSRLPGHLSPDLWHSMLIILILLIHATTRQQWNASWQSKRRRSAQILSTAIVTVARNSNGNETGRDASWRASLPCARVKTVKHSKLHIRFSDAKTVDGYSG